MLSGGRASGGGGTWAIAGITASIEITKSAAVRAVNLLMGISPSILFFRKAKAGKPIPAWGQASDFKLVLNIGTVRKDYVSQGTSSIYPRTVHIEVRVETRGISSYLTVSAPTPGSSTGLIMYLESAPLSNGSNSWKTGENSHYCPVVGSGKGGEDRPRVSVQLI